MKVSEQDYQSLQKRVSGERYPLPDRSVTPGCAGVNSAGRQRDATVPRSPYKSKLEGAYAGHLHLLKLAGDVLLYRYEPVRMTLMEGVVYVPDFYVRWKDGQEEWHEVKGYAKARNQERGMMKLRVAQATWPHWRFILITKEHGVWIHTPVSNSS